MNPNAWSTDPDSNDRIDPPIDWREGEAPGLVNDSARAMMAAVACLIQDTNGSVGATGVNTYVLPLNRTITDYSRNFEVAFFVATTNTGPVTLSSGSLQPKRLQRRFSREMGPGDLTPGVLYRAVWIVGLDAYTLVSPDIAAPGEIRMQAGPAIDPGWLACDGRAVSKTAFAALYSRIGGTYGEAASTFNLPDSRGRAPFGVDAGANRLTGAGGLGGGLGGVGGSETVTLTQDHMPVHTHGGTAQAGGGTSGGTTGSAGDHDHGGQTGGAGTHGHGVTIDQGGAHAHTGTANPAGGEGHAFSFAYGNANINAPGAAAPFVADINAGGVFDNQRLTSNAPSHTHPVTIDQGGAHGHTGSVTQAGDHQHGIPGSGAHTHTLPPAAAHTHPLDIANAGGGAAHSNIPPGLVMQFVIKT